MQEKLSIVDAHVHVIEHIAGFWRKGEFRAVGNGKARWIDGEEAQIIPPGWGDTSFSYDTLIEVKRKVPLRSLRLERSPAERDASSDGESMSKHY
jgi:hypothetical protein